MSGCYDITTYFLRMDEIFHGESRCKDFFSPQPVEIVPWKRTILQKVQLNFFFSRRNRQFFFFFLVRRDVNRLEYLLQFLRKRFSIAILDPVLSQRGGNRHEWTDIFLSFFFFVRNGSRLSLSREITFLSFGNMFTCKCSRFYVMQLNRCADYLSNLWFLKASFCAATVRYQR